MAKTPAELKIDWPSFIIFFNNILKQYRSVIEPITFVSDGKQRQIQRIVNAAKSKEVLIKAVKVMASSDVCNGRVRSKDFPKGWLASFYWMTKKDETIPALATGWLKNPPPVEPTEEERRRAEAEQRQAEREERQRQFQIEHEAELQRQREARDRMYADAAKGDELKAIFAELDKTFDRFKPKI